MTTYPTLGRWLRGAKPGNPWLPLWTGTVPDPGICAAIEDVLALLEATAPSGLAGLRKRFGDDDEGNAFGLRTELLLGYHLAKASVPFRFGGRGEPDLCCTLSPTVWIEARMRGRDDIRALLIELKARLDPIPVEVTVNMARRLAISEDDQRRAIERIATALGGREPSSKMTIDLPEVNGAAVLESSRWGVAAATYGATSSDLGTHLSEVERELANVVSEKADQSRRNGWDTNTIVVIDASRLGTAWLRPEMVWKDRLNLLAGTWEPRPFIGVIVLWGGLTSTALQGAGIFDDNLAGPVQASVDQVLAALGMPVAWLQAGTTGHPQ